MSSFVKTWSVGRRLTRYAPFRIASDCIADTPDLLLLMLPLIEPASLIVSGSRNLRGGAKSSPVNVPDFLSK